MSEEEGSADQAEIMPARSPVEALRRSGEEAPDVTPTAAAPTDTVGKPTEAEVEFLGIEVADLHLLCTFDMVSEITEIPPVYRVPHLPPWVTGATSLRGDVAPVVDLARYLDLAPVGKTSMLVVIGDGDNRAGLLADGRPDIHRFSPHHKLPSTPPTQQALLPYLRTAYQKDGVIWLQIDLPALFEEIIG